MRGGGGLAPALNSCQLGLPTKPSRSKIPLAVAIRGGIPLVLHLSVPGFPLLLQADGLSHTIVRNTKGAIQEDSTRDEEDAKNDFWTITGEFICRHHDVPRVKLYVLKEESFPIPLKYVTRTTHTSMEVLSEKHIKDYLNVDGEYRII